jgi:polyribonucleotide nucleotidyltransferase
MASACAGTLAMLDAGVPLLEPVAGVSIGLVTRNPVTNLPPPAAAMPRARAEAAARLSSSAGDSSSSSNLEYRLLTDIMGLEDHYGDMDFKVCGSRSGVTAIQLDVKLAGGIPLHIIEEALDQVSR